MRISDGSSDVCSSDLLLNNLADKADQLIIGGGIANTFLAAAGYKIGKSLCEMDMLDTARKIRDKIQARGGDIPLPEDVVCATEFRSEEHTSELQSLMRISYAVFCLKKKNTPTDTRNNQQMKRKN